jgi:hypothetical protein
MLSQRSDLSLFKTQEIIYQNPNQKYIYHLNIPLCYYDK